VSMTRVVFAVLIVLLSGQCVAARCLEYEPAVVKLRGRISERVFPGPPEFASVKEGDTPEVEWILQLATPVCVNANVADELNDQKETGVTRLQLVLGPDSYKRYRALLHKPVLVKGTLYHAITMHHHTAVLLTVESISAATAPSRSRL
jgi:hypothetical protein